MIDDLAKSGRFNYAMSDFCLVELNLEHLQGKRHPEDAVDDAHPTKRTESKLWYYLFFSLHALRRAAARGRRHKNINVD